MPDSASTDTPSTSSGPEPRPGTGTEPALRVGTLSATFVRRPIATSLIAAGILLLGLAAFPLLPVAPIPEVEFPTISVSASLPGASPEIMASNVATPLERQFASISGLTQMTSSSILGATSIALQFDLNKSVDAAAQDVQSAINAAAGQLPANLPAPPTYRKINPADQPILIISMTSDSIPLPQIEDYAENILAQALSQVSGVGNVIIFAPQRPAIRIQFDPAKVAALGLDLESIREQIVIATANAPKGSIDGPRRSMAVYDNDQILKPDVWNDVIVAYRGGAPIRVRDLGRAVDGPENTKMSAAVYRGRAGVDELAFHSKAAVVMGVIKQPNANVIEVAERAKALLPRLQEGLPAAVDVHILTDRTQTIRASIDDVEFTLAITVCLVVMVIFMFLRNVAATVIPSVTIPLALLGTAALMYVAHFSLDNVSLMALTIAVGFVVDDAIVMLENIYHYVERGEPPLSAALKGAAEISFTIVSISVSLVAVFIPILLMGGIIGRLMREFAYTVAIMVGVSVILSLTLTPMLCSRFLRTVDPHAHGRVFQFFERGFERLLAVYTRALRTVLAHAPQTLAVFLATVMATALLYVFIPKGFFPQQDTGYIIAQVDGAQDMSMEAMAKPLIAVSEIFANDPDVEDLTTYAGQGAANSGQLFVNLKPKSRGRTTPANEVMDRLRPQLARVVGVRVFMQVNQDINVGARAARTQYQYSVTDTDLAELNAWAPRVVERLRGIPQLTDVATDQQNGAATANLTIDRDQAARFGIQPTLIDATLYDAIGQRQIAQYFTQVNSYRVIMEVEPALQRDPALFDELYVASPRTGGQVPLATLLKVDTSRNSFLSVSHQGQYPAVTISFNLAPGVSLGDAVSAINAAQAELRTPATLHGTFQGTAQAFQASLATQPYLILAALVTIYIVLGVLYESYLHPLTILSTLPSAGLGALLILWACGYDLSVIALIGILLLIGIVKKNGIMMVDFALQAERERGLTPEAAIFEACIRRFRPIMMTTMCALLAGVPLAVGHGTGSEIRRPLGIAMVGGLILSQALTLFTTPVVYLYLDRARHAFAARRSQRRAAPRANPPDPRAPDPATPASR